MKKVIGFVIILIFLGSGVVHYFADENFKELSNAIITIIGLFQACDIFFDKSIDEINEKTSMILSILENDKEE